MLVRLHIWLLARDHIWLLARDMCLMAHVFELCRGGQGPFESNFSAWPTNFHLEVPFVAGTCVT